MAVNPFQALTPKKFVGIDVGTYYIKIVEISKFGNRLKLENYGSIPASALYEKPFRTFEKNTLLLSSQDVSRAIKAIMEEAKIKTRKAILSIPDFCSFFTNFELPSMKKEELPQAIRYEAKQHVPMHLGGVTLDWDVIEGEEKTGKEKIVSNLKILLVAVPNEVINQYKEIGRLAGLELVGQEVEVFSLMRGLTRGDEKVPVAIIDVGAQSTTCSIIDQRVLKMSHSFDVSGNEFTRVIAKGLNVDYLEAERLKKNYGVLFSGGGDITSREIKEVIIPLIDMIIVEMDKIFNNFYNMAGREVGKVIVAGGTVLMPNFKEYLSERLLKPVEIADPFFNIFYPPILDTTLKEMGPSYAIAVGAALRGLQ